VVIQFPALICRIPALNNDAEVRQRCRRVIVLEPLPTDDVSSLRGGILLVLARKVIGANLLLDLLQLFQRFADRIKHISGFSCESKSAKVRFGHAFLVLFGDRWKAQHLPVLTSAKYVPN